jgi:eukaryotic-like serine/threonine-protein kinase
MSRRSKSTPERCRGRQRVSNHSNNLVALSPGTRLGAYEILAPAGSGGMGEVYKARDTRLDRPVAIKVLPTALAGDPQFRERFDREARAISQLTHPHICTLYDVGEQHGTAFLILEYLEGETLEQRLKKGALPLVDALKIAIEIAQALNAAHRHGVIHRDLKPGNVMMTKTGAKLLDFGLAKTSAAGAMPVLSMLPTTPPSLTAPGTILGTFQYLAPEQLEGKEADARTDLFAFGAVLYEMLTGTRAFEGKTQANLIGAILEHDPPSIATFQPLVPPALDRIVQSCLAKDPDERWQTARDLLRGLIWLADSRAEPTRTERKTRERTAWGIAAVAFVLATALAVPRYFLRVAPDLLPVPVRFEVQTPATTDASSFALSGDGRQLAFVASGGGVPRLWFGRSIR